MIRVGSINQFRDIRIKAPSGCEQLHPFDKQKARAMLKEIETVNRRQSQAMPKQGRSDTRADSRKAGCSSRRDEAQVLRKREIRASLRRLLQLL